MFIHLLVTKTNNDKYPVLYLLHGGGGDEDAWTTLGLAPRIMDNLIAKGKAKTNDCGHNKW